MMASSIPVPENLPQLARLTTPDEPWPLRLLSAKIAEYIAAMSRLWVEGEITSLVRRSGARVQFFTLADLTEKTTITCKIFSHNLPEGIESGSRVVVAAKPDFWQGNGSLSLHIDEIRPVGIGDILARLEALKNKLALEGLFDLAHKKQLPFLPQRIGLIVGRNTKALHDVQVNARARWASAEFEVREVQVQGPGSVEQMIAALAELDAIDAVDVIVLARGGGSVDDLLPFSDERLIRAVFAANTPVVSAIGHETDNPILDLVADVRASTPTDAARKIVPDVGEELAGLKQALTRGRNVLNARLDAARADLANLRSRPFMREPGMLIESRAEDLHNLRLWNHRNFERILFNASADLASDQSSLRTLSPLSTLERGYAVIRKSSGAVLASASEAHEGMEFNALLHDGSFNIAVSGPPELRHTRTPAQHPVNKQTRENGTDHGTA